MKNRVQPGKLLWGASKIFGKHRGELGGHPPHPPVRLKCRTHPLLWLIFLASVLILVTGCDLVPLHMRQQPYYRPLVPSTLFEDGTAARPIPANTIPRGEWGQIMLNEAVYTGKVNDEYVDTFPMLVTQAVLERGQERYDIFCSPCHSRVGDGQGMIVQRGFPQAASFHTDRLRQQPDGYYYEVISNGFGRMYSYASRIHPKDRWAIVAYIRALQLSQNFPVDSLPAEDLPRLDSQPESKETEESHESE